MIKPNSEFGYKLMKPFVLIKFKSSFHPVVMGMRNIPNDKPIIVCGNHRHKDDQYNIMLVTKRVIHYLAKDEYFKGPKEWFYRLAGCIKVDRSIHDTEAKSEAMLILNEKGAVGIFPEGTRNEITCKEEKLNNLYKLFDKEMTKDELIKKLTNRCIRFTQIELLSSLCDKNIITIDELKESVFNPDNKLKELLNKKLITKEEYYDSILLPFKFGAVSLASKSGALIVPFGTRGDYSGKKDQLITKIGKPIDVKGMDLEKANKLLRDTIIDLMQN